MASSSSKPRRSYHVFLSFRGPDVRNHFLSHLYSALDQAGIRTYKDDEKLRRGEEIPHALMNAIEDSQIAIIIFSENYASSPWCLDELTKIIECRKQKDLIVWPVFYKVEPYEVRTPRESYRKALDKHEIKFGKDSEKVKRWKEALFYTSFLSGEHFTDGSEAVLVQRIVREISTQLRPTPLDATKSLVGIDSRVQELKSILNLQFEGDVLMVGLCGPGGVGKTTLAEAIYNTTFREFQVSCFLGRIKDNSNDLVRWQKILLSKLLLGDKLKVASVVEGCQLIKDRLCNKKVLIILDDVDHRHQLDALAKKCEWFGKGSRIIITTRDQRMVTSHWKDSHRIYKVKTLKNGEALELFRRHASMSNQEVEMRRNLVDGILRYAKGLPLALEVLGRSLHDKGEKEWKETLKKLDDSPDKEINGVLRVSWDPLDDDVKQIFLDIACFFKGQTTEYITRVLSSCGFYVTIGLQNLIEHSFISEENGNLQMHDLIQSMGMDIVKEECRDYPEKRSRLWLRDDVLDVLSRNGGTEKIKAIVLMLPKLEKMHIGPHAFTNMRKLRLLILHNVDNSCQDPIHLPGELRYFEWPHCASTPDFRDASKNLVWLDMRASNIKEGLGQVKDFKKLKFINLGGCQSLLYMPDLSYIPNLQKLVLHGCKNLEHVHDSIANHRKLQSLNLGRCSKLQRFPDIPNENKSLQYIYLDWTSIEELPTSIKNLVSLKHMFLFDCKKLVILPSSIYKLQNLEVLLLKGCSQLIKFPKKEEEEDDLSEPHTKTAFPMLLTLNLEQCHLSEVEFLENLSCPRLFRLKLSGNNFTNLPTLERLNDLEDLEISNCQQLQEIPKIPKKLRRLEANNCKSLKRIPSNICDVKEVELYSSWEIVHNGFPMNDLFMPKEFHCQKNCRVVLPGGEMPKWLLPNKEGYISFVTSKDLYEKILGVAFCVVFEVLRLDYPSSVFPFELIGYVNCKGTKQSKSFRSFDLNNVWLEYMESKDLWTADHFGPNDLSHFHISIRVCEPSYVQNEVLVKKCGFRLICKSLENDSEVLLQDDQLLDPALLYEISHEDYPMSTDEESSSETEDLHYSETVDFPMEMSLSVSPPLSDNPMSTNEESSSETEDLLQHERNGFYPMEVLPPLLSNNPMSTNEESLSETEDLDYRVMVDFPIERHRYSSRWSHYRNVSPGREMPRGFVLVEDGTISFMASQDLYKKFKSLYLCVVFSVEDGKKEVSFDIVPHVNSQRRNELSGTLGSFDTDHVWFQLFKPNALWGYLEGAVDFGQFDKRYLQFNLDIRVAGGTMKKLGYVMHSGQLEDALKVEIEKNRLMDSASLFVDDEHPMDYGDRGWRGWKKLCKRLKDMHGGIDSIN
ncbi:hypothetical protein ACJRO7_031021 [Eucalyptus globulus]|uniref:TIR domain-containing protein n=1 Tax=Eucalyptus globulus TaxID=34317 RepID=A0ABD3JFG2_EUCGL